MSGTELMNKFYFQWHITDACNLRCSHCYQENYSPKSELPLKNLKKIADGFFLTLSKWNKKGDISITGGEPLLRKDLLDFAEYLNNSDDIYFLNAPSCDQHSDIRLFRRRIIAYRCINPFQQIIGRIDRHGGHSEHH